MRKPQRYRNCQNNIKFKIYGFFVATFFQVIFPLMELIRVIFDLVKIMKKF
jgi:hypothetical protein